MEKGCVWVKSQRDSGHPVTAWDDVLQQHAATPPYLGQKKELLFFCRYLW